MENLSLNVDTKEFYKYIDEVIERIKSKKVNFLDTETLIDAFKEIKASGGEEIEDDETKADIETVKTHIKNLMFESLKIKEIPDKRVRIAVAIWFYEILDYKFGNIGSKEATKEMASDVGMNTLGLYLNSVRMAITAIKEYDPAADKTRK